MKADTISTLAGREILRTAMARNQTRLNDTLKEFSTGRHADVGRALGGGISSVIDMRGISKELEGLTATNSMVGHRLTQIQSSLGGVYSLARGLVETGLSVRQNGSDPTILVADAKARLASVTGLLSSTADGAYVFSGTNTSSSPIDNYLSEPPGPARSAVIAAFATEFGFPPDDPQAVNITPAQMQAYLDGPFSALFDDPAWGATFSNATDDVMRDRISPREEIDSSASVNDPGIRKVFFALTLAVDGGFENLNAETRALVSDRIVKSADESSYDVVRNQAKVGIGQERLAQANERISIEKQAVVKRIGSAEGVDAFEVAERLSLLMTRIESSYAVTARMQQLSLLNYL